MTVRTTVEYVAQTLRDDDKQDPKYDKDGNIARILQRQYKGYKNMNTSEEQQKELPCCVLRQFKCDKTTEESRAIGELTVSAFLFAMRSCEYSRVTEKDVYPQTNLFCVQNTCFFRNRNKISYTDPTMLCIQNKNTLN